MFRYETHLHTAPVSKCGRFTVRENLEAYKRLGYTGVFVTNHFLDGNINIDKSLPYEEKLKFYFSDYEEAKRIGEEIGLSVFLGVELSYKGTDFLIYGLDRQWYFDHPQIMEMEKSQELTFMAEQGALVIQAHPYRKASYIDHIRLFPWYVHGIEVCNACRTDFENDLAAHLCKAYELLPFAGTDNHVADQRTRFAGMESDTPVENEADFIQRVKAGNMQIFTLSTDE